MNVYRFELRSYRGSILSWTISLAFVCVFFMALYPTYANNADDLKQILAGYSNNVLSMFGLDIDSFFSILGFYSFTFVYLALCAAIQATNLGLSIISKENRNKTADFLLTKPINRSQILTGKLLAVLTALVITNIVFVLVAAAAASIVSTEELNLSIFVLISLTLFFIQLVFAAISLLIGVVYSKIKSIISVSLSIVFGFFILSMLQSVLGDEALRYITPFKYFDPGYIIANAGYDMTFVVLAILVIAVSVAVSYILYMKKDVHSV